MSPLFASAAARVQDSAAALQHQKFIPVDSVVVESPLPTGVATVVRFLMNNVPPWVQIGGVILGAVIGLLIVVWMFRNRVMLLTWLSGRKLAIQWAIGIALVLAVGGAATAGTVTWNYTQHSNDFCTGCHVMNPAFQKFSSVQNKHTNLKCHDCHQQSIFASARQLYFWVAERPAEIKVHSKVANEVCAKCHITPDTAKWQRVATTAGHRVHLESDSSVLKGLQCVKCHGVDVHQFQPVDKTCGQSECHKPKDTKIVLGKMASQTALHCAGCHAFTADVPVLATRDSAKGTLVPGKAQCLGCHEMSTVMADFNEGKDPHGAKCGTCHNPHTQKTPAAAAESCASSGCHANWADNPFHAGAKHKKFGAQCLLCHKPHASKIDASDCEGCHLRVRAGGRLRPPLPFDTNAARRRSAVPVTPPPYEPLLEPQYEPQFEPQFKPQYEEQYEGPIAESDDAPLQNDDSELFVTNNDVVDRRVERPPPVVPIIEPPLVAPTPILADSFPHARHTKLACLECHGSGARNTKLTFERPRGCLLCHHQAPKSNTCETCHLKSEFGAPKSQTVTVTVQGKLPKPRTVTFLHDQHTARPCLECHTTPITMAPSNAVVSCNSCHVEHHEAGRTCTACHTVVEPKAAHNTLAVAHQRCDACHTPATIARLTPTRSLCGACHATKVKDHYDARECTACHFLASPVEYKQKLTTPPQ